MMKKTSLVFKIFAYMSTSLPSFMSIEKAPISPILMHDSMECSMKPIEKLQLYSITGYLHSITDASDSLFFLCHHHKMQTCFCMNKFASSLATLNFFLTILAQAIFEKAVMASEDNYACAHVILLLEQ